jgi:hypothetical protein
MKFGGHAQCAGTSQPDGGSAQHAHTRNVVLHTHTHTHHTHTHISHKFDMYALHARTAHHNLMAQVDRIVRHERPEVLQLRALPTTALGLAHVGSR